MPVYGASRAEDIDATPQTCFDALTDFERLPEWQRSVLRAEVLERDDAGRATLLGYEVDVKLKVVRYRLRQAYEEPFRITSEYVDGDFRSFGGEWRFSELGAGRTRAAFTVDLDLGRLVPGRVRQAVAEAVVHGAVLDLKAYVER